MNRTLFVTAIYSYLYGSQFGGRPSRNAHYKLSLLNLIRGFKHANFVCYTSFFEIEELRKFFYQEYEIPPSKLKIKPYDLIDYDLYGEVSKLKQPEQMKVLDRCYDLQYLKTLWLTKAEPGHDYYFWIDAGISYSDLIPNQYLKEKSYGINRYFEFNIYNDSLLENLIEKTGNKIFLIAKNNQVGSKYDSIPENYYKEYNNDLHIIGGLFGGKKKHLKWFNAEFEILLRKLTAQESVLYFEEFLYTNIYYDNKDRFTLSVFDNWQHDPTHVSWLDSEFHVRQKSFYKVFEELQ